VAPWRRETVVSDSAGRFTLTGAPAGRIQLHAEIAGHAPVLTMSGHVHVVTGTNEAEVMLVVEPLVVVRGVVTDPDDLPLEGARITSTARPRVVTPMRRHELHRACDGASSGSDGAFEILVPAQGEFELAIHHDDFDTMYFAGRLPLERNRFSLSPPSARAVGRCGYVAPPVRELVPVPGYVRDAEGNPVDAAVITIDAGPSTPATTASVVDGRFVGVDVPRGPAKLFVRAKGHGTAVLDVNVDDVLAVRGVEVQLPVAADLRGLAIDDREAPLAAVFVCAVDAAGCAHWSETDRDGVFGIAGLAPGPAMIRLEMGEPWTWVTSVHAERGGIPQAVELVAGREVACVVRLADSGLGRIEVALDGARNSIAAVDVRLDASDELEIGEPATTGILARSALIAEGSHVLSVNLDGTP
jgi:hypothetical protein